MFKNTYLFHKDSRRVYILYLFILLTEAALELDYYNKCPYNNFNLDDLVVLLCIAIYLNW